MSAKSTRKRSSFSGEIRAHPKINFVLGYVYVHCKDGGRTYTNTKCNSYNILLSLKGFFVHEFSHLVLNSYIVFFSKINRPKRAYDRGTSPLKIRYFYDFFSKILGYVYANCIRTVKRKRSRKRDSAKY
jgi:hypothetical protein